MKLILTTLLLFAFRPDNFIGEPVATLTCKSESGRTLFSAELPSCSYLAKAEFLIDGSKLTFSKQDQSFIIFDPTNKVFTIYLESATNDTKAHKFIKFWALPDSFKKVKRVTGPGSQFHDTYEFRARIFGSEPRKDKEYNTKEIELACTLDYEL
jgi:hypothetical protein